MTTDGLRPTPLEIAVGLPLGDHPATPPLPDSSASPRAALEELVTRALARPPCLVSFSGGRDSSTILAVATRVARRDGLALPVPATLRFPRVPGSDESRWQERIVRHLGLQDWIRLEFADELDVIGPVAAKVLRRHGVLSPPSAYVSVPLLEHAKGGSLLTGFGGDATLAAHWRWSRAADVLARRVRPQPRDALRVALAASPAALRRTIIRGRGVPAHLKPVIQLPWLRPNAQAAVVEDWFADQANEPARWQAWIAWQARRRIRAVARSTHAAIAADVGTVDVHPFFEPVFLGALARAGGRTGWGGRTELMRALFADLLPDDLLARRDKPEVDPAFFAGHTRAFLRDWSGGGIDTRLVDEDALRKEWAQPTPPAMTALLLQSAWLATQGPA
jgi:hypothetical protein